MKSNHRKSQSVPLVLTLGLTIWLGGSSPARADLMATFTPLGNLAGGPFDSTAYGDSADGKVVVGYSFTPTGYQAFRWTAQTGMVGLGGGTGTSARAASADGSVIVGFRNSGAEAFRWTAATGVVGLGHITPQSPTSQALGVSANGQVVVGYNAYSFFGPLEAFRWTAATGMVGIGHLPGYIQESSASAISADGNVIVGGSNGALGTQAFRWTGGDGHGRLGILARRRG